MGAVGISVQGKDQQNQIGEGGGGSGGRGEVDRRNWKLSGGTVEREEGCA